MEEREHIITLYEYYKELLTDNQRSLFEDYYFENLTMEEIKENNNISKNAVSKQLITIKEKLIDYEIKLHLLNNKEKINKLLSKEDLKKIINYI